MASKIIFVMYKTCAILSLLVILSSASPLSSQRSSSELVARHPDGSSGSGQLLASENGRVIDMSWLNDVPAGQRANINVPGVVVNGNLVNPAPPGSTAGASAGGSSSGTGTSGGGSSSSTASISSALPAGSSLAPSPGPLTTSVAPPPPAGSHPAGNFSISTPTNTSSSSSSASGSSTDGCPPNMKGVTFNGGFNPGMFDTIRAASEWITFSLNGGSGGSPTAQAAYIPMMAFASDVPGAVSLVTGPNPPAWMLTFNEPDYSYMGQSPTMSPQDAATAIAPLLTAKTTTKFVAPVTADSTSDWLDQFYSACNCKSFFSAYNIHIYAPTSSTITAKLSAFHAKYPDEPLWLTEVAPGMATPACSLGWDTVTTFMKDVYRFAAGSGYVDRVFWNSGNEIGGGDQNVCNSYLLDGVGGASPLLEDYQAVDCS